MTDPDPKGSGGPDARPARSSSPSSPARSSRQLLHIGAGIGRDLPGQLAAGYSRIVLVEPNPDCAPALTKAAADRPQVTVISAAVSDQGPAAVLNVLNLADLSSLHEIDGLKALLPGVRVVARPEVETLSAPALCDRLEGFHADEGEYHLVLEAPGSEAEILRALRDAGHLRRFETLVVTCGRKAFYTGAVRAADLRPWLEAESFRLLSEDGTADPDWPVLHFELDRRGIECAELSALLAETEAELAALRAAHDTTCSELDGMDAKFAELRSAHEVELAGLQLELETDFGKKDKEIAALTAKLEASDKLRLLVESDLQEQKDRFSDLQQDRDSQDRLILGLIEKLEGVAEDLSRADAGAAPK